MVRGSSPGILQTFFFSKTPRPALGSTRPRVPRVPVEDGGLEFGLFLNMAGVIAKHLSYYKSNLHYRPFTHNMYFIEDPVLQVRYSLTDCSSLVADDANAFISGSSSLRLTLYKKTLSSETSGNHLPNDTALHVIRLHLHRYRCEKLRPSKCLAWCFVLASFYSQVFSA